MKKISVTVIVLAFMLIFSACGNQTAQIGGNCSGDKQTTERPSEAEQKVTLKAQVVDINNNTLLVCGRTANELVRISLKDAALIGTDGESITADALRCGMSVDIDYNGTVLETYPSQIVSATKITVTTEKNSVIALYTEAVEHIYNENSGINGKIAAIDLTRAVSLSEGEKSALVYILGNIFSEKEVEVIASTRETLMKDGAIEKTEKDGVDFYTFKDGVLITVSDSGLSGGKITFDLIKWRSSLASASCNGNTAECKDGKWSINYGESHVS